MQERILKEISKWSSAKAKDLAPQLQELTGQAPKAADIERAQNLLSQQLHRSEGINIYTIHSFCQKVLKQFPIEAGVPQNFKIIDEINQQKILSNIRQSLVLDEKLETLVTLLLSQMHDTKLNELVEEILNERIKFKNLFS
jgi:ATP-dependent helicase/nuclease subunit A